MITLIIFEFMQYFSLYIWRVIFNSPKLKRENFGELNVSSCEKGWERLTKANRAK